MKPPPEAMAPRPTAGPHPNRKWNGAWRRVRTVIQDHPAALARTWRIHEAILTRMARPFTAMGLDRASRWVKPAEELIKRPLFDCRMCGQCVLHVTGMTCPMTCPKQIRNGPCGGVRRDGTCEVHPEMQCVWVQAVGRSAHLKDGENDMAHLNPPVDWRLEGTASWVTFAVGRDRITTGSDAPPHSGIEVMS